MQFRHTDMTLTNLFYDGFFNSELKYTIYFKIEVVRLKTTVLKS